MKNRKLLLFSCSILLIISMILFGVPAMAGSNTVTLVSGTVPLIISDAQASAITTSDAVISWNTNGPATSEVFYDTITHPNTADYAFSSTDISPVSTHSIPLSGLLPLTVYFYRAKSVADTDLTATSDELTFKTLPAAPVVLPLDHFTITGYPSAVTAGANFGSNDVIVTAYDSAGNIKTDYTGQVYFTSTDSQAVLPYTTGSKYTFTSGTGQDNGIHTFVGTGFTLKTPPSQTITVTDGTKSATSDPITVNLPEPGAPGTLQVIKNADGDGTFYFTGTGGNGLPVSFSIVTSGGNGSQTFTVDPGSYSIFEIAQSGWDLARVTVDGNEVSNGDTFTVDPASTVIVTFKNDSTPAPPVPELPAGLLFGLGLFGLGGFIFVKRRAKRVAVK